MENTLQRFLDAQEKHFRIALSEIKAGRKRSHWMWYIFPQIKGLGHSETSVYYALKSFDEARQFLNVPRLRENLLTITSALLQSESDSAAAVFGSPDDLKLFSSMTLFSMAAPGNPLFQQVLDKFFAGKKDAKTLQLLRE